MKKEKSFIRDVIEVLVTVIVITFILTKFILMPCMVNGTSMYPTLHDNDRVYSFIITKNLGIKRFDICVISAFNTDAEEKLLVKRVIGMPNETVEYKDNKLYINGEYVEEDFLNDTTTNDFTVTLGEDEYYCLGDNRVVSRDSRYYGPFKKDVILATNIFVIYPFANFGVKK